MSYLKSLFEVLLVKLSFIRVQNLVLPVCKIQIFYSQSKNDLVVFTLSQHVKAHPITVVFPAFRRANSQQRKRIH